MKLDCVVMNTQSPNHWLDSISLFDYCFDNFQLLNISENETNYVSTEDVESGTLNENEPFVELDKTACIVLPKTAEFSDAESTVLYNDEVSPVAGTLSYTYAGHEVGGADIVTTGVKIEGQIFDNQIEESTELSDVEETTIQIKPITIFFIVLAILLLIVLLFLGKYVYDNFYIIRHNMSVEKSRKDQFKRMKNSKKRRRRRGFFK